MREIIVDTSIVNLVFTQEVNDYNKLRDSVIMPKGKCILIYGGAKFLTEYKPILRSQAALFNELAKIGRVRVLDEKTINKEVIRLEKLETAKNFDDPHIVSCIIHSKCEVVCTNDKKSDEFIKDRKNIFYKKPRRIKIFRYPSIHNKMVI